MIMEMADGFGHSQKAWVVGCRGSEYLITANPKAVKAIEDVVLDLYSDNRTIKWVESSAREASWLVSLLVNSGIGSNKIPYASLFVVGSRALNAVITTRIAAVLDPPELAGMVVEYLMDLDILVPSRLKRQNRMLLLDRKEMDAWLAAAYLALEKE